MIHRKPGRDIRPKRDNFWDTYYANVENSNPYIDGQMLFAEYGIAKINYRPHDISHSAFCETKHCEYSYEGTGFQQYEDSIYKKTIGKKALERCYDNKSKEEAAMCLSGIFYDKSLFRLNYCFNKDEPFNWIKINPIMPVKVNKEE